MYQIYKTMKQFFLILFTYCTFVANAQTPTTLGQSIDYTLKNHPSLKVFDNHVAIAQQKSNQSISDYLPQVSGTATWTDNLKLQTTILPAGIFSDKPTAVQFGTKYTSNMGLDFNQTLFDQTKIAGIKANKPYSEMTQLQRDQNRETLVFNTASAYFQVLIYREQLKILTSNQEKYQEMLKVLEFQLSKGTVLEKDVDRIKVNLNSTNYQIEDATTKEQLSINTLKNAMGMPLDQPLLVADSANFELHAMGITNSDFEVGNLVEARINEKSVELQEINLKSTQAAYLPSISAVGKYGAQSLNNNFGDAFTGWKPYSYIGLSINVPVFSGFKRKSMVEEEKLNLKNDIANFNINNENLKLNYENTKTSLGTSYSSFKSNRDNMALAEKLLGVTNYQYQQGAASLTDYLNDDTAFKEAQSNYINSLYNVMISQLNYQKSRGNLLQFINQLN